MVLANGVGCLKDPNPQVPQEPKRNIVGTMTSEIGEFDPNQNKEANLEIDASRPLHAMTAGAYQNILGQAAKIKITQAVALFNAEHGRYPKDYEEFMEKVIRQNQIELPVLSTKHKYQYDVENHELIVVEVK
jgi:ribosomal protein S16